ncbi:MAG: hypothetical protein ACRDIB_17140, partial [Ardenticatenaceae bacterium]
VERSGTPGVGWNVVEPPASGGMPCNPRQVVWNPWRAAAHKKGEVYAPPRRVQPESGLNESGDYNQPAWQVAKRLNRFAIFSVYDCETDR